MLRDHIIDSVKHIYCNMYASADQIADGFPPCQACKYRGHPIELVTPNNAKWTCPINEQLAASDVTDTAVRIEEQTVLFLPTSEDSPNLQGASAVGLIAQW